MVVVIIVVVVQQQQQQHYYFVPLMRMRSGIGLNNDNINAIQCQERL
jgi:hypothetical protein